MSTLNVANISDGTDTVETVYVVNGSAKAWVNFNGTGTVAIRGSLNTSSMTDNGTGNYTQNFASSLSSTSNACSLGSKSNEISNSGNAISLSYATTSQLEIIVYEDGSRVDSAHNFTLTAGGLA